MSVAIGARGFATPPLNCEEGNGNRENMRGEKRKCRGKAVFKNKKVLRLFHTPYNDIIFSHVMQLVPLQLNKCPLNGWTQATPLTLFTPLRIRYSFSFSSLEKCQKFSLSLSQRCIRKHNSISF